MDLSALSDLDDGQHRLGIPSAGPASNVPTGLTAVSTPSAKGSAAASLVSIHNPLTAFAVLLAVTTGLMAWSTSVRVGNSSASLDLGKT